jgi:hypothetical protein
MTGRAEPAPVLAGRADPARAGQAGVGEPAADEAPPPGGEAADRSDAEARG